MSSRVRPRARLCLMLPALLWLAGCGSTAPPPTPMTNPLTVLVPFTPSTGTLDLPTLLPTVTAPISGSAPSPVVIVVTATPPTITPTTTAVSGGATRVPTRPRASATPAATVTPFPENVPRVYVTALSVNPATPKANVPGTFSATFQNLSGAPQQYNWCVEIWQADNVKKPFGLTTCQTSSMPIGVTNLTSTGWDVRGLGECTAYRARVVARDEEDNRFNFIQADGSMLWLNFSVCP